MGTGVTLSLNHQPILSGRQVLPRRPKNKQGEGGAATPLQGVHCASFSGATLLSRLLVEEERGRQSSHTGN